MSPVSIMAQVEGSGTASAAGAAAVEENRFGVARKERVFPWPSK
jgi:hypothetical protein